MKTIRLIIVVFAAMLIAGNAFSQSPKCEAQQKAFLANKELKNAAVGLYAENLTTGDIILDYNSCASLTPASIQKLFTTAMAMEALGSGTRFKTKIAYSGTLEDSVVNGDLYIIGGGDPCLGAERYSNTYSADIFDTWTEKVKEAGIKKINGNIISDVTYFGSVPTPGKWVWEDLGSYYGSRGFSINYMDNTYEMYYNTGSDKDTAVLVRVVPDDLELNVVNKVTASSSVSDDNTVIYRGYGENDIVVCGTLPCNKTEYKVKGGFPNPPHYVARTLYYRLRNNGVAVTGTYLVSDKKYEGENERTVIHTFSSPSVGTIVNYTNLVSYNLYAEVLALQIMRKTGKSLADYGKKFLSDRGIESGGFYPVDGSGLSHFDAINAKQTAQLLKHISKSKYGESFISGMAVAGKSGTLKSYKCSADGTIKVQAKTGSMTRVRSLAGIITNTRKEKIVFCIIINNYEGKSPQIRNVIDNFIKAVGHNG
ncbi:MAG: D-alanyl-D-alanine carboxypeptidase/D-alanyl-D-alanine-endopeptidase [Bacteroidales bacterium]|nr:D-alanyl-D-alanine carboxypeptidase/D-alanyl-D-alanine-endopeptidase [Bacteroidales bacterium]